MVVVMENAEVHWLLIDIEKERNALWAFREENRILRINPISIDKSVHALATYLL